jgi:hypothetical protein
MTRKLPRDYDGLPGAHESHARGRQAFKDGISFAVLPLSSQSLVKAGWLDELADQVQELQRRAGPP